MERHQIERQVADLGRRYNLPTGFGRELWLQTEHGMVILGFSIRGGRCFMSVNEAHNNAGRWTRTHKALGESVYEMFDYYLNCVAGSL